MRIVFWQNCLSPHQLPYIVHLLDDERVDSVVVASGELISEERKKMGWDVNSYIGLGKCEVHLSPALQTIDELLSLRVEDSYHIFSGIRGFQFVFTVFQRSLKFKLKRCMVTERPNTYFGGFPNGKPLWLHWLRWKIQERNNIPMVEKVFAMGGDAVDFYSSVSSQWKVIPFGYCTQPLSLLDSPAMTGCPRISFVGSLSWRKSVDKLLISTMMLKKMIDGRKVSIRIIGDGMERQKLEKYKRKYQLDEVDFLGTRRQSEVPILLSECDVLVLPSIYDGWGAVVNEALQAGLYVICSDKCGAKDLLGDSRCGSVFAGGDSRQLAEHLKNVSENIDKIRADRKWRIKWAERCISGKVMAKYMIDCLMDGEPILPWNKVDE